jgi:HEAT repeat protein
MMFHSFALLVTLAQTPAAPPKPPSMPTEVAWMRLLSDGWVALASGRPTQAEATADAVLRAGHARHDAVSLKIHAGVLVGPPERALEVYDQWAEGKRDDVFLLQPIAQSMLTSLADSKQADVRSAALAALARNGDAAARAALQQAATIDSDAALAAIGDAGAVTRLRKRVSQPSPGVDQVAAIDALVEAKAVEAVPDLVAALDPARPAPARAAAARGLGILHASDATAKLRDLLNDSDGTISTAAAVSLASLGDPAGANLVAQMENSPVLSVRLAAAEVAAEANQPSGWVGTATAALRDPDPLTRLTAAKLLLRRGQETPAAAEVLSETLADSNPAIQHLASQVVSNNPEGAATLNVGQLRHMLRDASPQVRIAAAGTLLRLAGGTE